MKFLILFFVLITEIFPQAKISRFSKSEIDSLLRQKDILSLSVDKRMLYYSGMFLDMPYNLTCTGDGKDALYETEPLVNFNSTNCMVFCEHVLALSISDSWENFFNNLQKIRYNKGIIGMRTRNHYTMADWLPANSWLLHNAAREIAGNDISLMTRKISHKKFFEGKGIKDLRYVKDDRELTIEYLSFNQLKNHKNNLRNGDIVVLLFKNLDNIFAAHMLMYYEEGNKKFMREASLSKKKVLDTDINAWIKNYLNSKKFAGVAVIRLNKEINQKGKVILPWEIN